MKKHFLILFIALSAVSVSAQQMQGIWAGSLKIPGGQVDIIFNISQEANVYQATMDIPAQGAKGIRASSVAQDGKRITINLDAIKVVYAGEMVSDSLVNGEWQQSGMKLPLNLARTDAAKAGPNRPQTPKSPFPYEAKEVSFENKKSGIKLAGTLTVPRGNGTFPAVILVSGSGPQNRDSEIFGHKSFAVIADYLTRNGIAVLRYDDRGVGQSGGAFSKALTYDFAEDAAAALEYLRAEQKMNPKKVGLIGHSEGGLVGPIVASGNSSPDFLVLLAAPAMEIDELMLEQARLIGEKSGASADNLKLQAETNAKAFALLKNGPVTDSTLKKIEDVFVGQLTALSKGSATETAIRQQAKQIMKTFNPWFIGFMNLKPKEYLGKVTGPVLALNGSKDLQVPPKQNLEVMRNILGKNPKVQLTAMELPDLNHLFQTANTGNVSEYGQIEETFSPTALKIISDWILMR
ncbi:alpha/beta hydrolase family protein [Dyadobacter psychrotolerans]|uniref:Alpha/beta fold hydrolase n=1 Tax=Dyadobacter psychrotolerans TaxID=2541721 RepID=A0A4R5DNT7_9BACT|nr:alpha/beta fold hydrolase [Dyadobacter psychrotolerans]TDE13671.1 alpha/beta fold hydrolase [Dyadobacter psychrotolerans]